MVEKSKINPLIASSIICASLIYAGIFNIRRDRLLCMLPVEQVCTLQGRIVSNPVKTSTGKSYRVKFCPEKAFTGNGYSSSCKGTVTVFLPAEMTEAYFPGKLYSACEKKGAVLCGTGMNLEINGSFSSAGDIFFADSGRSEGTERTLYGQICFFRILCRLQFRRLMYAWGEAGGLLLAILSGIREYTENDTAEAFRNAGLSHILALSGMHLSLFSGLAVSLGKRAGGKKTAYFMQAAAIILFTWFAGFSPSLLRAFICSMIMIAAAVCNIKSLDMKKVLALSFLIHSVIAPEDLYEAAFMLSYGALAGMLLLGEIFNVITVRIMPPVMASSIAASAGAQNFTAPVSMKLFKRFAPAGIIASVVVSPLITVFIYCGLALIILCLCFPICVHAAAFFMKILYTLIKETVTFFAVIPGIEL